MIITAEEAEEQAILSTAKQMMAAIHTAPKGCGMDKVKTIALTGSDKDCLADEMMKINAETGLEFFKRDSENVRNSALVILVGVPDSPLGMPHFYRLCCQPRGWRPLHLYHCRLGHCLGLCCIAGFIPGY